MAEYLIADVVEDFTGTRWTITAFDDNTELYHLFSATHGVLTASADRIRQFTQRVEL